jgi:GNAT superfamily N-acetyltransferase
MIQGFVVRPMRQEDVPAVVALQKVAFPPPFSEDLLWDPDHLVRHVELFPEGQFVGELESQVVASCSNCIVSEAKWQAHGSWTDTVGGPFIENHDPNGSTLYGLDVSVHPDVRRAGIGRAFYNARFDLVRSRGLRRYGTACRIPDYRPYLEGHPGTDAEEYVSAVLRGVTTDRTLTPLLRYGIRSLGVIEDYMEDAESRNAAALLEWIP